MQRAHGDLGLEALADHHLVRNLDERIEEFVLDGFRHIDALHRHAHLTGHTKYRVGHALHGLLAQIRIVEHDRRIVAAELQSDAFDALGGIRHDVARRRDRAGEADLADVRMSGQPVADFRRNAGNDIERAGWQQAGNLLDGLDQRERAGLRRLDHHGVAGEQRRDDLHEGESDRTVPRHDRDDDAVGPPGDEGAARGRLHLAVLLELVDQFQGQTLALADADQFAARLAQGLAVLAHEQIGTRIDIIVERIEAFGDDLAALAVAERRPAGLRRLGRRHRAVDVLGRAAHDRADDLIGPRRIAHLDPFGAVDPLAIDQQAGVHGRLRIG